MERWKKYVSRFLSVVWIDIWHFLQVFIVKKRWNRVFNVPQVFLKRVKLIETLLSGDIDDDLSSHDAIFPPKPREKLKIIPAKLLSTKVACDVLCSLLKLLCVVSGVEKWEKCRKEMLFFFSCSSQHKYWFHKANNILYSIFIALSIFALDFSFYEVNKNIIFLLSSSRQKKNRIQFFPSGNISSGHFRVGKKVTLST